VVSATFAVRNHRGAAESDILFEIVSLVHSQVLEVETLRGDVDSNTSYRRDSIA
jgi:hypothetical protein